jgi:hypothetical protein
VPQGKVQKIGEYTFPGFGAHTNAYPVPYLTIACSIGGTKSEMETFLKRLDSAFKEMMKKKAVKLVNNNSY